MPAGHGAQIAWLLGGRRPPGRGFGSSAHGVSECLATCSKSCRKFKVGKISGIDQCQATQYLWVVWPPTVVARQGVEKGQPTDFRPLYLQGLHAAPRSFPLRAHPYDMHTSGPRRIRSIGPGDGPPGCTPQPPCLVRRACPEDQPAQSVYEASFGLSILLETHGNCNFSLQRKLLSHSHQSIRQLLTRAATAVRH